MMAQIDTLREKGHSFSEVCNESVIEAVDFNPYMHAQASRSWWTTARTLRASAARAPRFDYNLEQQAYVAVDQGAEADPEMEQVFLNNPAHIAIANCCALRPSVDISVKFGVGSARDVEAETSRG